MVMKKEARRRQHILEKAEPREIIRGLSLRVHCLETIRLTHVATIQKPKTPHQHQLSKECHNT